MRIEQVFKTSKGLFWSLTEAEMKVNRQKDTDPCSQNFGKYEPVQIKYVLVSDIGVTFELTEVSFV